MKGFDVKKLLLIPALALMFGATACGGDSDGAGGTPSSAPPSTSAPANAPSTAPSSPSTGGGAPRTKVQEQMTKVADCLRKQGFEVGDPNEAGLILFKNVKDQNAANKAMTACRAKHVPTAPPGG